MNSHAYGYEQGVSETTERLRLALDLHDSSLDLQELLGVVSAYVTYFDAHYQAKETITKARS
jgi:signal transduction histidine kinase